MKSFVLAGIATVALTLPAAAGGLYFDAELLKDGPGRDEQPLVTLDTVAGLNQAIGQAALRFHHRFRMDDASTAERATFLGVAGYLAFSAQRANAIVIGHEGAHFHAAGLDSRTSHSFVSDSGEPISWIKAWGKGFLTGHVGGTALSRGDGATPAGRIEANNAGLNWQSDYSDRMLRRGFAGQDLTVFSAGDYLLNANYWLIYSSKDKRKNRPFDQGGDPQDLVEYLEATHGIEGALDDMVKWSALSFLVSAANWQAIMSMNDYVNKGDTGLFDGKLTWNVVNYGYEDSFSVAPVAHLRSKDGLGTWIGGFETSVIGDSWTEVTLGASRQFAKIGTEGLLTVGNDGALLEVTADYRFDDRFSAVASATAPLGDEETRRGSRLTPDGDTVVRAGISIRF